MTILREDVEDLGRLGDKEVARVVEEFEARLKVLKENHTKELEVVKSTLSDNHKKELEVVKVSPFLPPTLSFVYFCKTVTMRMFQLHEGYRVHYHYHHIAKIAEEIF